MKKLVSLLFLFTCLTTASFGQSAGQVVKGKILDTQSKAPLVGATVVVLGTDPVLGTTTDAAGNFKLINVPLGRQTLGVRYLGYKAQVRPNVIVTAGKEVVVPVEMEEQVISSAEVVITGERARGVAQNEFASVSACTFNVEETSRFAGSRNDPARMAANFAGVSGANDFRNDIVIRGNSPAGVLWRLEGINIPNPNHYGALGSTGGPVSMINYNVLDKSDFMTAAFPAQYGNAVAGVFDLRMRSGNPEKHEYLGQIGFNGFEVGAEGPLRRDGTSSFLVNYRYSTLGVFQALGLEFGTGSATPHYQDVTYKVDLATKKLGTFSFFGLGGISKIDLLGSEGDTTLQDSYGSENEDSRLKYRTGVAGVSNQFLFNPTTYLKTTLSASTTRQQFKGDSVSLENRQPVPLEEAQYQQNMYSLNVLLNKKFNARNTFTTGVILDWYAFDLSNRRLVPGSEKIIRNNQGRSLLTQGYAQWQHRFTDNFTVNSGLNVQHFGYSGSLAVEPRLGLKYFLNAAQSLSFGYGRHSQMQPLQSYFTITSLADGTTRETNKNLDFGQSQHLALGYENHLSTNLRLKTEIYYQRISNAAVETRPSSFSMLNSGADFVIPDNDSLRNAGRGRNYGLELTLEKSYSAGYYYLLTASLFDSKYKGSDQVWRNTAFNGGYVLNALAGKEFKIGRQANAFNLDWKMTVAGGNYYTPIDYARSRAARAEILQTEQAFSRQAPDYFRTDLKLSYRLNRTRLTHEFSLDLQNLTGRKNVFAQRYNVRTNQIATEYQIGFFPVPQYRILF